MFFFFSVRSGFTSSFGLFSVYLSLRFFVMNKFIILLRQIACLVVSKIIEGEWRQASRIAICIDLCFATLTGVNHFRVNQLMLRQVTC